MPTPKKRRVKHWFDLFFAEPEEEEEEPEPEPDPDP